MKTIDVFGIGSPLVDLLAHIPDNFLEQNGLEKDRMYLVDLLRQKELLEQLAVENLGVAMDSGGSCANSMISISRLGGKVAFNGKIGKDEHGKIYKEKMEIANVTACMSAGEGATGTSVILVCGDASRTMNTHLGMSQEFRTTDVAAEVLATAKYIYVEGYLWDAPHLKEAVLHACDLAEKAGVKIALTLSDPFCVERHLGDFKKLIKERVDLVFCNREEAYALTGTTISQKAIQQIGAEVETVAMTLGPSGALINHQGEVAYIDPVSAEAVDTTGAGDAFAAGFLYGITQEKSYLESGRIAAFVAARIIEHIGAQYRGDLKTELVAFLSS